MCQTISIKFFQILNLFLRITYNKNNYKIKKIFYKYFSQNKIYIKLSQKFNFQQMVSQYYVSNSRIINICGKIN